MYLDENDKIDPVFIQSAVVRLDDGSLVIINPTDFPESMQEAINKLGQVKAIITPTSAHGAALSRCHKNMW
jgi:hypothetical protein